MGRTLFIAAVLAALVATTAASAARRGPALTSTTTELMPGVTYTREVDMTSAGPVVLDVVTAPKPDGTVYTLAPVLSNGALGGTARLTQMEKNLRASATTVGIDGDYFAKTGQPNSILMQGGVLENEPKEGRTSLGITADGTLQAAKVSSYSTWSAGHGQRRLDLNSPDSHFALFTPAWGSATPRESGPVAEAVFSSFPPAAAGHDLAGAVSEYTQSGMTPIPPGGAVLVARGAPYVTQLPSEAPVGQQVTVHVTLTPDWSGLASAIGGGPLLVQNGKPVFSNGETFRPGFLQSRMARGAVGQLADGSLVLVTAEAAAPGYSVGVSAYDLARELVKLGAVTAVALGAGPQAGMAFDGSLLTRPAAGTEPLISDALVLSYSGVYAPPVAPFFSPNGDGASDTETLAYRLVRPSTVTATLSGPNGATVPVSSGAETAGVHTFTWDGVPLREGAWTFSVSATDDRDVQTTAERAFTLDNTLRSLTVRTSRTGAVEADFVLRRRASVVISVEKRDGTALATLRLRQIAAAQWGLRVPWKHKRPGKYLMRVDATSSIGTSSLVALFSLK